MYRNSVISLDSCQKRANGFLCKIYNGKKVSDGYAFLGEYIGWGTALVHVTGNAEDEIICYMASDALVRKRFEALK